jgi:hypothetical protein
MATSKTLKKIMDDPKAVSGVKPAAKTKPKQAEPQNQAAAEVNDNKDVTKPADKPVKTAEKPSKPKADAKKPPSKMELAISVYNKMKDKPRQDILAAFMSKAGLTKAGAATYLTLVKAKVAKG